MDDRTFWHSNPDALLVSAAQALEAKRELGAYLGRPWEHVDDHLAEALLELLKEFGGPGRQRRAEDRRRLTWVSRLLPEVPPDDPRREQIRRRLREVLRPD